MNKFEGRHVVIVHGYTATPRANWFPWLAKRLEESGARVDVPPMPASHAPVPSEWASRLMEAVPEADSSTLLVGHSLGCVAILRHLLALRAGTLVGGLLLVSGFDQRLGTLPALAGFTPFPLDHRELRRRTLKISSLISSNDGVVDPAASIELAARLGSTVCMASGGGHFLDRDGFVAFHQAYDALLALAASPT